MTYLPLLTAMISLVASLVVAFIGIRNSRNIEASKVQSSHFTTMFQKILEEYQKYDPSVRLVSPNDGQRVFQDIQEKFLECMASIRRVKPLIRSEKLVPLEKIEEKYYQMAHHENNQRLKSAVNLEKLDLDMIAGLMTEYVNKGYDILKDELIFIRKSLEGGDIFRKTGTPK